MIHKMKTKEGEILENFETPIDLECDETGSSPSMLWPVTLIHKINDDSPFYKWSAIEMLERHYEIVLILEGTTESTGQNTHARTSYVGEEILWGKRFVSMVKYNHDMDCFEADYRRFQRTVNVQTPLCSAEELEEKGIENVAQSHNMETPDIYRKMARRRTSQRTDESYEYPEMENVDDDYKHSETSNKCEKRRKYYNQNLAVAAGLTNSESKDLLVTERGVTVGNKHIKKITWV